MMSGVYVGCAGWSIPGELASKFAPEEGGSGSSPLSHLERYALRLPAVEINSSFYRPHRPSTYARWAASVPEHFRFSVKLPRQITHIQRLQAAEELLSRFLDETEALGEKRGPVLVQLPPGLAFEEKAACAFFEAFRSQYSGTVVCEPRHSSWFQSNAERALHPFQIARVATDPAVPVPEAAQPGWWNGIVYYRLHGSPRIYYSDYSEEYLDALTQSLAQAATKVFPPVSSTAREVSAKIIWCIFDNTAQGAATENALGVLERLHQKR